MAFFVFRGDFAEQLADFVDLVQISDDEPSCMQGAFFRLCHCFIGDAADFLGFHQGGSDASMFNQAADGIGQHGAAVCGGPADFKGMLAVSHLVLFLFSLLFISSQAGKFIFHGIGQDHFQLQLKIGQLLLDFGQ